MYISDLPDELLASIFYLLGSSEACKVLVHVNQRWCSIICNYDYLWKGWWAHAKWDSIRHIEKDNHMNHRYNFVTRARRERNWRKGNISKEILLKGANRLVSCLDFEGDKVVVGCGDSTLKLYDMSKSSICIKAFKANTMVNAIEDVKMQGDLLGASTPDGIRLWSVSQGKLQHLFCQDGLAFTVQFDPGLRNLYYGFNKGWKVIDLETTKTVNSFSDPRPVRCLQIDNDILVTGGYDTVLKVYDVRMNTLVTPFQTYTRLLQFQDNIIATTKINQIILWDIRMLGNGHAINSHKSYITCMSLNDGKLISGSYDKLVNIFGVFTSGTVKGIKSIQLGTGSPHFLKSDLEKIVFGFGDDIVIWKL